MTETRRIVSNTGPLISLEKLRQGYDFIRQLYDTIIIPLGVLDEVAEGQFATPQAYLQHYGLVDIDFAARTVTLALRDVHNRSVHQHVIAFDELGVA